MTSETTDLVTLLLPVLWAIISAAIALVLYRTSEALFESVERSKTRTRRIRLAGSVAIAALAFYGMSKYTPSSRLTWDTRGIVTGLNEIDRDVLDAQGALAANDIQTCGSALRRLQHAAAQLRQQVKGAAR
jgi:hypothetical protein